MSFDRLLERVNQRIVDYWRSSQPDTVLSGEVLVEAEELWQAAQPANLEHPTPDDIVRLATAQKTLGWLHFTRCTAQPTGAQYLSDLARTVIYFAPSAHDLVIPEPLLALVGATADANRQANLAADLLQQAVTRNDPALLDATIWLLADSLTATLDEHPDRAVRLSNLGHAYRVRFERGAVLADIKQAVEIGQQAVAATRDGHPDQAMCLSNLGIAYQCRFERGGVLSDLDLAINSIAAAVAATPDGHSDQAMCLSNLGNAYRARFERAGELADLDQAIQLGAQAVAAKFDGHPSRVMYLSNLGIAHQMRYERGGVLADLNRAIEILAEGVAATPDDHPNRPIYLSNLCNAYRARFEHTGGLADIEQAVHTGMQSVAAAPGDHPNRVLMLVNMGNAYLARFERGGRLGDLDRAIENYEQAAPATPEGDPRRAMYLCGLTIAYERRFERGGALADLNRAIEIGRQAVAATPDDHPNRATMLSNLGNAYQTRFVRRGTLSDLDQAIDNRAAAVAATPDNHPNRAKFLSNLGSAHLARYRRRATLSDLDQAIDNLAAALAATPDNHPNRATMLSRLGNAYQARFERGGTPGDLDQAIDLGRQAVTATHRDDRNRAVTLSNLGITYRVRFERGGAVSDLDQAIESLVEAVATTPDDHPNWANWLSSLSLAYVRRFELGGVLADLDRAIEISRQAVAATPDDHPDRAVMLSLLGIAYRVRFERGEAPCDIELAIEAGEQAVAATPDDHPNRAVHLSGLGLAYQRRSEHGGVLADVDRAIEISRQAVAAIPNDHSNRTALVANLGNAYLERFARKGTLSDIKQAIESYEEAAAATPDNHADRARWLFNVGNAYQGQLTVDGQGVESQTVLALARAVNAATTGAPVWRVLAGQAVGSLAHAVNEHRTAVQLLDAAVSMLPSIPPREAGWVDQEHRLGEHQGLVGETVGAHCAINDPVGALEAAELGRGILLSAQLDSRSDLTALDHAHPDLAAEFRRVRDQLNAPPAADTTLAPLPIDPVGPIEHRRRWWTEHDRLLARVRRQPGFDRFLLPPRLTDLQPATAGGAAIMVNIGRHRSDAIIVTAEADPVHVPLPDATVADLVSNGMALQQASHNAADPTILQRAVSETLGWLWDAVVAQALEALPPAADGTSTLPRVWWLPIGLLGLFPLHAAGHLGQPGALDAVISSYIPTLRALARARTRPSATVRRQLTVALHHTPGLPELPGTVAEATTLHAHHPDATLLVDEAATTSRVLGALPKTTWAHFACHASADLAIPSQGGLALHDAVLALPQISQLQLGHAELAYLSACSTADRGLPLADEVLHLATAFQLAGFRHVIASLWPLNDRIAATAAASVYQHLPATPTADHAATALNNVVRELRASKPNRPELWAALIHSGP